MAGSELLRTLLLQASIAAVTSVPSQNTRTGPLLTLSLPCEYPDCKNIIRLFWLNLQKVSKLKIEMRESVYFTKVNNHIVQECQLHPSLPLPDPGDCNFIFVEQILIDLAARVRWQLKSEECWGHSVQTGQLCPDCLAPCSVVLCAPRGDNAILCHNANVYCWLPIFCPFSHYLTIHISICAAACKSPKN